MIADGLRFAIYIQVDSSVPAQGNGKHEQLQTGILSEHFMTESLHSLNAHPSMG